MSKTRPSETDKATIARLKGAKKRLVWEVDVGDMSKDEAEECLRRGRKIHRKRLKRKASPKPSSVAEAPGGVIVVKYDDPPKKGEILHHRYTYGGDKEP
jgi:hypothetical protein